MNYGSFCKFTIGRLPEEMEVASQCIVGLEKLSISLLDLHGRHYERFHVRVHSTFRRDAIIDFRFEDVLHPARLCNMLVSASEGVGCKYTYINSPEVSMAHHDEIGNFHLLESSQISNTHCLVVSQVNVNGQIRQVGTKAVEWETPPSVEGLHRTLAVHFGLSQDLSFSFFQDGESIATLHSVVPGTVILHCVMLDYDSVQDFLESNPRSRSRTPPGVRNDEDEFSEGSSLLQLAVRRSSIKKGWSESTQTTVIVDKQGTSFITSSEEMSAFQILSKAVTHQPNTFRCPHSWYQSSLDVLGVGQLWVCGLAELPIHMTTVVVEWILVDRHGSCLQHQLVALDVERNVDWQAINDAANHGLQVDNVKTKNQL